MCLCVYICQNNTVPAVEGWALRFKFLYFLKLLFALQIFLWSPRVMLHRQDLVYIFLCLFNEVIHFNLLSCFFITSLNFKSKILLFKFVSSRFLSFSIFWGSQTFSFILSKMYSINLTNLRRWGGLHRYCYAKLFTPFLPSRHIAVNTILPIHCTNLKT